MKLSDTCIKRPVFAIVLSLIIVLIGISGYHSLKTRYFPLFTANQIGVNTVFPGASAKLVETAITNPLESELNTVSGIKRMTSESSRGNSSITLKLKPGQNLYKVANDVRNKVSSAQGQLPDSAKTPTIQVGWSQSWFMNIAITDPNQSPQAIRDYTQRYIIDQLLQISGMANIVIDGADKYAMRIELDPQAMASRNISASEVQNALRSSNLEMPAGTIKGKTMDFPVTANTRLKSLSQFKQLIIKDNDNQTVHLGDIAQIKLGSAQNTQTALYVNGKPGVLLQLFAQSDASPISVSAAIKPELKQIKQSLPQGMKLLTFYDQSVSLQQSVHEVYETIFLAIGCVLIAVFLFLGTWRAISIPITTIPVCLIGAFALMAALNFSINVVTLLALVLAVGLVVDDAIVMLENIHRHIEQGLTPMEAAFKGSRQIAFAVIGMTICLVAVYAPVGLMSGQIATIFREFAFTLAGSVLISGFVSLTLSPMMCSRLLSQREFASGYPQRLEAFLHKLAGAYKKLLYQLLLKRLWVVIFTILLAISGVFILKSLPQQFMPHEDMGFIVAPLKPPTGSSFNYIKQQAFDVAHLMRNNPNINNIAAAFSDNPEGFNAVFATLKPYDQRHLSAKQLADQLTEKMNHIAGLNAFIFAPSPFSGGAHQDLKFTLMTSGDYKKLYHSFQRIKKALSQYPGLNNINSSMNFDSQQYDITVNRELAASMGVNISDIDNTIATLLGGLQTTYFDLNNYRYDVILQAQPQYLTNTKALSQFYVPDNQGKLIPLANLIEVHQSLGQQILPHYNHLRSTDISAQLSSGYTLGEAIKHLNQTLPELLPSDVKFAFTGMAEKLQENSSSMGMIFGLSLLFIYLVLAALFESFIDPLIILLTIPLCIVGALAALKVFGGTLNVFTDIGLITLVGLVSKHGILITQFTNELRHQGEPLYEAILKAAAIRLRPILMTTTAMVFGILPLLFTQGANAASRQQVGIVLISGLLVGTFFSLFVVPIAYSYLGKLKRIKE